MIRKYALALCMAVLLVRPGTGLRADDGVLVFAAASLTDVATALADDYAAKGHSRPIFAHAASSALARQIENGAPADIFISADLQWMDYLAEKSLIVGSSRTNVLANALVLIAPSERPFKADITSGFDLAAILGTERLAVADPASVPAGRYAQAALESLGIWPTVADKLVRADNVRSALAFVERNEVPAGIVYATDAAISGKVTVAGVFPASSHPPIVYPMAIVTGHETDAAKAFLTYLTSDAAVAVARRFGFTTP